MLSKYELSVLTYQFTKEIAEATRALLSSLSAPALPFLSNSSSEFSSKRSPESTSPLDDT